MDRILDDSMDSLFTEKRKREPDVVLSKAAMKKKQKPDNFMKDEAGRAIKGHPTTRGMKRVLDNSVRWEIVVKIMELLDAGNIMEHLPSDVRTIVALKYKVGRETIRLIWSEFYLQKKNEGSIHMISNAHVKALKESNAIQDNNNNFLELSLFNTRRNFRARTDLNGNRLTAEEVIQLVLAVNKETKGEDSIRGLSADLLRKHNLFLPKSTLCAMVNDYGISSHNSYLHPSLSRKNRLARCIYAFQKIDKSKPSFLNSENEEQLEFDSSSYKREVYLDEKLFYQDKIKKRVRYITN